MVNIDKLFKLKEKGFIIGEIVKNHSYAKRIADFASQLLINWCLVHYCTLTNREKKKEQWKDELKRNLYYIASFVIKENDSVKNRLKSIKECWELYEYIDPNILNLTVWETFMKEKIDISSIDYEKTLLDCMMNYNKIFEVITSRDRNIIQEYINSI